MTTRTAPTTPAQRAASEKLVAFPTAHPLVWECSAYTIRITGPNPADVRCSCPDSVSRNRACKHAETVAFYRREGLRPIRPAAKTAAERLLAIDLDRISADDYEYVLGIGRYDATQAEPVEADYCAACGMIPASAPDGLCAFCLDATGAAVAPAADADFVPAHVVADAIDPLHTYCAGCGSESFRGVTLCILCSAARHAQFGVKEPQDITAPWMQPARILPLETDPFADLF